MELTNKLLLKPPETCRFIDETELKELVICKRGTPSRCTYGSCYKCGNPRAHLKFSLFRHQPDDDLTYLYMECPDCGHSSSWKAIGYATRDWKPTSSFFFPRDSQRFRCYKWEDLFFPRSGACERLNEQDCHHLMTLVFDEYNVSSPKLRFIKSGTLSEARGTSLIRLSKSGMKNYIVLHECSHTIVHYLTDHKIVSDRQQSHGPLWVSVYLLLVEKYLDSADMLDSS